MLIYHTMVECTLFRERSSKGFLMWLLIFFHVKVVDLLWISKTDTCMSTVRKFVTVYCLVSVLG